MGQPVGALSHMPLTHLDVSLPPVHFIMPQCWELVDIEGIPPFNLPQPFAWSPGKQEGWGGGSRMFSWGDSCGAGPAPLNGGIRSMLRGPEPRWGLPLLSDHPLSPIWATSHPRTRLFLKTIASSSCSFSHGCLLEPKGTSPRSCVTQCPHP